MFACVRAYQQVVVIDLAKAKIIHSFQSFSTFVYVLDEILFFLTNKRALAGEFRIPIKKWKRKIPLPTDGC